MREHGTIAVGRCLSVRPSVLHAQALYPNGYGYRHIFPVPCSLIILAS